MANSPNEIKGEETNEEVEIIGYIRKSHHLYERLNMTDIEATDSCGTCDGALCDGCVDMYVVSDFTNDKLLYYGKDKQKAIKIAGYNFVD